MKRKKNLSKSKVKKTKYSFTEDHDWGRYTDLNGDEVFVDGDKIILKLCPHDKPHKVKKRGT